MEEGFPHPNQSAFHRHTGCNDAIFASQDLIARYISEGSTVNMCLFDLQKAFDSVEFPVLLNRLFSVGINGKTWRLIRNWYAGGMCFVNFDGAISTSFPIERGVCQGSILSPTLFDMDGSTPKNLRVFRSGAQRKPSLQWCIPSC